ncbi:hypothetical protein QR680_015890 [Steinernema hermaphroditum]|uniref:Uncharacterized protein n=1 Tax=Steinernema hermaphroditum TaxID=289476 RepID=A0AA39HB70_9BILA|nr:hypothetical protein QR680_015890 [Steinernema hermaphroditum]
MAPLAKLETHCMMIVITNPVGFSPASWNLILMSEDVEKRGEGKREMKSCLFDPLRQIHSYNIHHIDNCINYFYNTFDNYIGVYININIHIDVNLNCCNNNNNPYNIDDNNNASDYYNSYYHHNSCYHHSSYYHHNSYYHHKHYFYDDHNNDNHYHNYFPYYRQNEQLKYDDEDVHGEQQF